MVRAPSGGMNAEAQLLNVLSSTSPATAAMYYESEVLGRPSVASGDPSLGALLDALEEFQPPSASFDKNMLVGEWRLEYTNDLPAAVRDEVEQHVQDVVMGLSVVRSIRDTGAVDTEAVVSLLGGEAKVVSLPGSMDMNDGSSSIWMIDPDGKRASVEVTYA